MNLLICMILWGFLGRVNSAPFSRVSSGRLPEKEAGIFLEWTCYYGFPCGSVVKNSPDNGEGKHSVSGSGRYRFFFFKEQQQNIHSWWDLYACHQLLQSCPTLCNHMELSPPGSSVWGISQAKNTGVGWVAISSSRGSCQPRDQTHISCIAGRLFILSHWGFPTWTEVF